MKVYVVYESNYGEILEDCGEATCIAGVYSEYEKAERKVKDLLNASLGTYVFDKDCENTIDEYGGYYRLFYNSQENWRCYFEIIMEVREVE